MIKKEIIQLKNQYWLDKIYRILSKVNFLISNKFILDNDIKQVRTRIKYNLLNHQDDIIKGTFPIEFLDYKQQ